MHNMSNYVTIQVSFTAFVEGTYTGRAVFVDEVTGEYLWHHLTFKVGGEYVGFTSVRND